MIRRAWWILLFGIACAAPKPVQREPLPIPADLQEKVATSIEIGRALYLQDKVAAVATDAMVAGLGDAAKEQGIAGYLAVPNPEEQGRTWTVLFYTAGERALIKFRVRVPLAAEERPKLERVEPPQPVSEVLQFYIDIRAAALKAAGPFTQPINPIVMPAGALGDAKGDILVELIAGTRSSDAVVLGKHFRVIAGNDGAIKSVTPLSKGPLELSLKDKPAGLVVSELVADYPLEIHVLASLQAKVPLFVGNARGNWKVEGDKIFFIEPNAKER